MTDGPRLSHPAREDGTDHPLAIVEAVFPDGSLEGILDGVPVVRRRIVLDCNSGSSVSGTWLGVPFDELLDRLDPPGDTTHVVVRGADGQQACVPLGTALDGLLAVDRDGKSLTGPRFVAPGVAAQRAIKDVECVDPIALSPGEDRSNYESLWAERESDPGAR